MIFRLSVYRRQTFEEENAAFEKRGSFSCAITVIVHRRHLLSNSRNHSNRTQPCRSCAILGEVGLLNVGKSIQNHVTLCMLKENDQERRLRESPAQDLPQASSKQPYSSSPALKHSLESIRNMILFFQLFCRARKAKLKSTLRTSAALSACNFRRFWKLQQLGS